MRGETELGGAWADLGSAFTYAEDGRWEAIVVEANGDQHIISDSEATEGAAIDKIRAWAEARGLQLLTGMFSLRRVSSEGGES